MKVAEQPRSPSNQVSIDRFRVDQSFALDGAEVRQALIPVTKPHKDWFFRSHTTWLFPAYVLDFEQANYLVEPSLAIEVEGNAKLRILVPCITREGEVFIWPLGHIRATGQTDSWTLSANRVHQASRANWVRMCSHQPSGAYKLVVSKAGWSEPAWPETTLEQIVGEAFSDRVISDVNHPILQKLRGEIA
jgi:hypothetical protein